MSSDNWVFLQGFLKTPKIVASVVPSSSFLKQRVVAEARVDTATTVVELGPGTGGLTKALLAAMPPDSKLLAIEYTAAFVPTLQRIDDARFEVVNACASTLPDQLETRGLDAADAIVSGIPFSTMPGELATGIAAAIANALRPAGRFVAYQFSDRVVDVTRAYLGEPTTQRELLNIPPLRVFRWQKSAAGAAQPHVDRAPRLSG
ncbi:MAG: methyltransferase type 12 [Woeseiaceae bacterium]|nr:methyltransferase type 12 [Woeseiaceae bacterium]